MSLLMFSHFHRSFPFNHNSSWLKATYVKGDTWEPTPEDGQYINVIQEDSIFNYKHHYQNISDIDFLKAIGQQSTDYYVLKYESADYLGVTSYRRYLKIDGGNEDKIVVSPSQEACNELSSERIKDIALEYFQHYDVITNKFVNHGWRIDTQYCQHQDNKFWFLFLEAINTLYPEYSSKMSWFSEASPINYEGAYIAKQSIFKKLVEQYFNVMNYIWTNSKDNYPLPGTVPEEFPWRYPGFLNERFVPFFLSANEYKIKEVPLVVLK